MNLLNEIRPKKFEVRTTYQDDENVLIQAIMDENLKFTFHVIEHKIRVTTSTNDSDILELICQKRGYFLKITNEHTINYKTFDVG